jgi:hypothetical protein
MLSCNQLRILLAAGTAACAVLMGAWQAWSVEPRVAGLNRLVVVPPGTHERGLPAVRGETVDGQHLTIDLPPTLHVHRYYYAGDEEYQGPLLEGGPTVVVANHPKNGERMYIEITLPPGAPVISYNKSSITYVYPHKRIAVNFSSWHPDRVTIGYHSGQGFTRRTQEISAQMLAATRLRCSSSATWQALKECGANTSQMFVGGKQALDGATSGLLDRTRQLGQVIPGVNALSSLAEQRDERANQAMIREAEAAKERATLRFVPTNR